MCRLFGRPGRILLRRSGTNSFFNFCRQPFGGVPDYWQFQVIDQDRGPGGRVCPVEQVKLAGELFDYNLVGDPQDMNPLDVDEQQVEEIFFAKVLPEQVDIEN